MLLILVLVMLLIELITVWSSDQISSFYLKSCAPAHDYSNFNKTLLNIYLANTTKVTDLEHNPNRNTDWIELKQRLVLRLLL